jgi:hypothetical protein
MSYAFKANPNMKANHGFDEVMIVNPYDPHSNNPQNNKFMRFHESLGYYLAPGYGAYAQPAMAAHEPVGYISEEQPMGWYGEPEMVGYADYEPLAEPYPEGVGYYGEPDIAGYVRETATPAYNPGCPMPTNVAGFGEGEQFAGYQRPSTVNPTCEQFTPQPGITEAVPETFRPLW